MQVPVHVFAAVPKSGRLAPVPPAAAGARVRERAGQQQRRVHEDTAPDARQLRAAQHPVSAGRLCPQPAHWPGEAWCVFFCCFFSPFFFMYFIHN